MPPFVILIYLILGLLFVGLAIPLLLNKIPPNSWYGFRTRLTLEHPEIWYPVNAWSARWLLGLGLATLAAVPLALLMPEAWLPAYVLAIAVLWVLALALVLAFGVRYARRLDQAQRERDGALPESGEEGP